VAFLFVAVGFIGFHPSDDGFLLAQSQRILRGEIPHLEVIFARPMGSAFLHTLDFLIPLPLFEASRFTGLMEIVAYSYLFAWFTYSKPPVRWRFAHHVGAIGAALVNLHTFPSMAWHTTDGLLLTALGLVLIQRAHAGKVPKVSVFGLLALGAAPLMKQSFFLSPLLGVVWVAVSAQPALRLWTAIKSTFWASLPGMSYVVAMATLGALPEFSRQLFGASPVWGKELMTSIGVPNVALLVGPLAGLMAFAVWSDRKTHAFEDNRESRLATFLVQPAVLARVMLTVSVISLPALNRFEYRGSWGFLITWILFAYAVIRLLTSNTDARALVLLAVAWMTCLSWGYPHPNLVGGTVALQFAYGIWHGLQIRNLFWNQLKQLTLVSGLIATTTLCVALVSARRQSPYNDFPASELTANLLEVSPNFGGIRTNPITAEYLTQMASCVRRFPAPQVAVLPDNPGIYPALDLHNPFPTDWMLASETAGHNVRIRDSAKTLDARGGYLVLFQTIPVWSVPYEGKLEPAGAEAVPFSYDRTLTAGILGELTGERVACGVFVGIYSP
jgi:hypothetical protein